ncbi:MAG: hypothetical protein ACXVNQ_01875, partial [Bacteroidia bacterium]
MKNRFCFSVLFFCVSLTFFSQIQKKQFNIPQKKVFSPDSLIGFNEESARKEAAISHVSGQEFVAFMARAKRNYIKKRYNLQDYSWPGFSSNKLGDQSQVMTAACSNEDFETGNITGWTLTSGTNNNSATMGGCCPTGGGTYSMMPAGTTDPASGLSVTSPLGGN